MPPHTDLLVYPPRELRVGRKAAAFNSSEVACCFNNLASDDIGEVIAGSSTDPLSIVWRDLVTLGVVNILSNTIELIWRVASQASEGPILFDIVIVRFFIY